MQEIKKLKINDDKSHLVVHFIFYFEMIILCVILHW